ncbi:MAG: hypothetical protein MI924_10685 [Chloroflexales bacterium]|nr:hypothetical protein [Chloroflexales bacterium]
MDDRYWDYLFSQAPDRLEAMADRALADYEAGKTTIVEYNHHASNLPG